MKKYILLFFSLFIFACNQTENERVATADSKAVVQIDGMTCEVGCKKVIEKKMRTQPGVVAFDIDFESKEAQIEYDSEMTNAEQLVAEINQINNGAYSAAVK
jgi:Cu+-exporting ATPase